MPTVKEKVYYNNLNTIRFIAALSVIIHHTEQIKGIFGLENHWNHPGIQLLGRQGVVLFFVLSGFLITKLLVLEEKLSGTIHIREFYIRRILRIWPLYFLITGLAFFVYPHFSFTRLPGNGTEYLPGSNMINLLLFVFFLPNLALPLYGPIPLAAQAWSIGAEEQFYLIWPFLFRKLKNKWFIIAFVTGLYLIVKILLEAGPIQNYIVHVAKEFWKACPLDCMAIGGAFSLISESREKGMQQIRDVLYHRAVQWCILLLCAVFLYTGFSPPGLSDEMYSLLFGILILNFALNPHRIFNTENPVTAFLGRISYGLYMFHAAVIVCVLHILSGLDARMEWVLYPLVLAGTISVAAISYAVMEKRFIRMKKTFSFILSGENAAKNQS